MTGRVTADITVGEILGHAVLWTILIIITLGIALMFYPYSFAKFVTNRIYITNQRGQRVQLQCDLDIASQLGHILIWLLITVLTLGLAYPFYLYKTWNFALNRTRVVPA